MFVSYDEGESWPTSRCIVPYSSAYSSLCILPDNTIGIYVEEDFYTGKDSYSTVFYNFSLEWLTKGADSLENVEDDDEGVGEIISTDDKSMFNLYPNPTSVNAEINLEMTYDRVEVYNSVGAKVAEYADTDFIKGIETAGVYVIKAVDGNDVRNCRIIVK